MCLLTLKTKIMSLDILHIAGRAKNRSSIILLLLYDFGKIERQRTSIQICPEHLTHVYISILAFTIYFGGGSHIITYKLHVKRTHVVCCIIYICTSKENITLRAYNMKMYNIIMWLQRQRTRHTRQTSCAPRTAVPARRQMEYTYILLLCIMHVCICVYT